MRNRKRIKNPIISNLEITAYANEGKALGRDDGKAIFVVGAMPGDVMDVRVTKSKKDFAEGSILNLIKPSPNRIEPRCKHFDYCGGCKWQHVSYAEQLQFKEALIKDTLKRLGGVDVKEWLPIKGSENVFFYRNKLEFGFSNRAWVPIDAIADVERQNTPALGYHLPGFWDKVFPVEECHLQPEPSESIRKNVYRFCIDNGFSFFNEREKVGLMRNLMIRVMRTGEVLVLVAFGENDIDKINLLMEFMAGPTFPDITSLNYVVNTKVNDTVHDLPVQCFKGREVVYETLGDLKFRISPQSFFQTNTSQAEALYNIVKDFADLRGNELVYDLYTGTGSIALFLAKHCKHVVGIEYVPQAIADAHENKNINNITNADFHVADIAHTITNADFIKANGKPDVVITDPPRAGMHPDVVKSLLTLLPEKIVYVSCNPATQARDLQAMSEAYDVVKACPVDMFPHTHHLENVALLVRKAVV